jgi:hypothetical protein
VAACPDASMGLLDGRRSYDAPVSQPSAVRSAPATEVVRLSRFSGWARLTVTAVVLALTLGGTVWGDDSEFPFGPFRMYSTRNDPNAPVISTRVVGLTAAGEEVRLSGGQVGLRRAEFEGQYRRLQKEPQLLGLMADAYTDRHPDAEPLHEVQVIHRRYELVDGQATGDYVDTVVVDYDLEQTP